MSKNYGLGRGLASLIPQKNTAASNPAPASAEIADDLSIRIDAHKTSAPVPEPKTVISAEGNDVYAGKDVIRHVDIEKVVANPHQPRVKFDDEKLQELSSSIKKHGVIQPLVVTQKDDLYELIAGERRLQASKLAGLQKVPVIVREAGELEKLELAIIENIQRHDLNPVEEAKAYKKLMEEYEFSQEEVAEKMGKSRSAVANKVRLLNLPVEIQKALIEGKINEGHAKVILAVSNPEKQRALFEMILKSDLTVRQVEEKVKEVEVDKHKRTYTADPAIKELENKLIGVLGTKVKVEKKGDKGKILIEYYSEEELNNIIGKIGG